MRRVRCVLALVALVVCEGVGVALAAAAVVVGAVSMLFRLVDPRAAAVSGGVLVIVFALGVELVATGLVVGWRASRHQLGEDAR